MLPSLSSYPSRLTTRSRRRAPLRLRRPTRLFVAIPHISLLLLYFILRIMFRVSVTLMFNRQVTPLEIYYYSTPSSAAKVVRTLLLPLHA